MLKDNTIFVLGAAYSKEFGLPLGDGLKEKIISALPRAIEGGGDENLVRLINLQKRPVWGEAANTLRNALPYAASIDNLVEHHKNDIEIVQVAKWAIATVISKEESKSELGSANSVNKLSLKNIGNIRTNGYHDLFKLVVSGVSKDNLKNAFSKLKIITFNYDRTLEVFLRIAVAHHSNLTSLESEEVVSSATILHGYGVLDPQNQIQDLNSTFNAIKDPDQIRIMASGIRTFSEKNISGEDEPLKHLLSEADRVIFLGCAFHRQNLDLIWPDHFRADEIYGTVYVPAPEDPAGHAKPDIATFSKASIQSLESRMGTWNIGGRMPVSMMLDAMTCRQLIARYGVRWTE